MKREQKVQNNDPTVVVFLRYVGPAYKSIVPACLSVYVNQDLHFVHGQKPTKQVISSLLTRFITQQPQTVNHHNMCVCVCVY